MDSRRILLVSHEMTPSGAPFALFYLGRWLKENGWQPLVAVRFIKQISQVLDALQIAQLIVVPTRQTARILAGASRTRIEVVPYGIPEPEHVAPEANGASLSFVALGSFEPRKGQDILVE